MIAILRALQPSGRRVGRSSLKLTSVIVGALVGVSSAIGWAAPTQASTAASLTQITVYPSGDSFYNYDFINHGAAYNNVDWGLDMLFWGGANITKVKSIYTGYPNYLLTAPSSSQMSAYINDGLGLTWDDDNGVKYPLCPSYQDTSPHMRVYAIPGQDYNYNDSWGYYVLGSTHRDWQECWVGTQYGWSEDQEINFKSMAQAAGYTNTAHDFMSWNNLQWSYWEGNHYWQVDGYASSVQVP